MQNEVIRHIHKYALPMYVMVSVPEVKKENIYKSPVILGCFKTKEDAKVAWKARTPDYKFIKAKTVHVYCFELQTDIQKIPDNVFFCGSYKVSESGEELHFRFTPSHSYSDINSYYNVREWLDAQPTVKFREFCKNSNGWATFYASNELFCVECQVGKLVKIVVPFSDVALP